MLLGTAQVTTGPATVPLVLAMGLGLGNAVSAIEGFGILSLASICPIVAVLSMGLFIRLMQTNSLQGICQLGEIQWKKERSHISLMLVL